MSLAASPRRAAPRRATHCRDLRPLADCRDVCSSRRAPRSPSGLCFGHSGHLIVAETCGRLRIFPPPAAELAEASPSLTSAAQSGRRGERRLKLRALQSFQFEHTTLSGVCVDTHGGRILIACTPDVPSVDGATGTLHRRKSAGRLAGLEVLVPASLATAGLVHASLHANPIGLSYRSRPSSGEASRDRASGRVLDRATIKRMPVSLLLPTAPVIIPGCSAPAAKTPDAPALQAVAVDVGDGGTEPPALLVGAPVPLDLSHVGTGRQREAYKSATYHDVYPPSMPDTCLFVQVLRAEIPRLVARRPAICLEVGCGASPLGACFAAAFGASAAVMATDVSASAMHASAETARRNGLHFHLARMDVVAAMRAGTVDVLACHPPYVPTSDELLDDAKAGAAHAAETLESAAWTWAGGPGGTAVLDRLLAALPTVLSPTGVAYVLFFSEEAFAPARLAAAGLTCECIASHNGAETFVVMRIERSGA